MSILRPEEKIFNDLSIAYFCSESEPGGKIISGNNVFLNMFSFKNDNNIKKTRLDELIINSEDSKELYRLLNKDKKIDFFETACSNKNKNVIWVAITATLVKSKGKKIIEGIMQNISSHREINYKISKEPDLLQTILDSIPDAIYFKDRRNRVTRVNKFYAEGFGGRLEKILGKTDFDFFPEDQARQMFNDDNYILRTGRPIVGKIERTLLPNGNWNQVITTKIPMFDSNGKIIGTMGITRDMTSHANLEKERYAMVLKALMVLGRALELRDPYTQTHARDVGVICQQIAREIEYDDDKVTALKIAAELHDLGKIGIPLDILIKPGKLSDLEYSLIKEHTSNCYNLIKDIDFPFPLAEIIYQHHERLDGSGYPRGLKCKQIKTEAKILAVADVLEAMTHHRPYRPALGIDLAIKELKDGAGIKYDKGIVDIVLKLIKKNNGQPFWHELQLV